MSQNTHAGAEKLHYLFIGAHPDDPDIEFGGTAIKLLYSGHKVTYLSLTNGDAGHHTMGKEELENRRRKETLEVALFLGIEYMVLDIHDGYVQPSVEHRDTLISIIREARPDIIVTHRPSDYHTDHRATSLLVQDAAYLVAVPNIVPSSNRLEYNPIILYHQDNFEKPNPFTPHLLIDISDVMDRKMQALSLHESQVFEWLPFIEGYSQEVPQTKDRKTRIEWLKKKYANPGNVNKHRDLLEALVSPEKFARIEFLEAFEISEYGGELTPEKAQKFFPFGVLHL